MLSVVRSTFLGGGHEQVRAAWIISKNHGRDSNLSAAVDHGGDVCLARIVRLDWRRARSAGSDHRDACRYGSQRIKLIGQSSIHPGIAM
jgi:hypothetical protein